MWPSNKKVWRPLIFTNDFYWKYSVNALEKIPVQWSRRGLGFLEDIGGASTITLRNRKVRLENAACSKFTRKVKLQTTPFSVRSSMQVLRYDRGGKPLWCSSEHVPNEDDIPRCACGAERQFEFQVSCLLCGSGACSSLWGLHKT